MTIALWCIFAAGLLPYLAATIAKLGAPDLDNHNPRGWIATQTGFRERANAAHLNCFETYPYFATAVLTAHILRGPNAIVNGLAVLFIAARVLFVICYLANRATARSVMFSIGFLATVAIFVVSTSPTSTIAGPGCQGPSRPSKPSQNCANTTTDGLFQSRVCP